MPAFGRVVQRTVARMPQRFKNGLFEAMVRAATISAVRGVTPSARFALNELFLVRGLRRYKLRRSGRTLFVRHPVIDAWAVREVINHRVYLPPPHVDRALRHVQEPRIVDLGAHIGSATLLFLERFPNARILAIEAQPENAALLRRTLAVNRLDAQREVPCNCRRARHSGVVRFEGADLVRMDVERAEWPILADPRFASLEIPALVRDTTRGSRRSPIRWLQCAISWAGPVSPWTNRSSGMGPGADLGMAQLKVRSCPW
jgi:hypothetical protein